MYDFSWKDPLSWVAIGVPVVLVAVFIISIWEILKWVLK